MDSILNGQPIISSHDFPEEKKSIRSCDLLISYVNILCTMYICNVFISNNALDPFNYVKWYTRFETL